MNLYVIFFVILPYLAFFSSGHQDHGHGRGERGPGGRHGGGRRPNPLPHFRKDELSQDFQRFKIPDSCSMKSKHCVNGIHEHARKCDKMFMIEKRSEISECERESEELRDLNMEWQVASTVWHTAIDSCLKGDRPPARTGGVSGINRDSFLLFKRKRDVGDPDFCRSEDDHHQTEFDNWRQCWRHFRDHRRKCGACLAQDPGCQKLTACMGKGPRPTHDSDLAAWYDRVRHVERAKVRAMKSAKRELFRCLGISHTQRTSLWE